MTRDLLFLLPSRFIDASFGGRGFHCAACVHVEGLLACFPELREAMDIRYVDYERPRAAIVDLLGSTHQGCPVLVLADGAQTVSEHVQRSAANGRRFVDGPVAITAYLSELYGIPPAHP